MKPVAVSFRHFDSASSRYAEKNVPLEEAQAYQHATQEWVCKVWFESDAYDAAIWAAPTCFWSYGKNWVHPDTGYIARIGAGAYGDQTIIHYDN